MTSQNLSKSKKGVHKLKDPRLRKIRYELRTLLHLIYKKRMIQLRDIPFRKERKNFEKHFFQCPIMCWSCGTRMDDLIQSSVTKSWFCVNCYDEDLDKQIPDHYF